MPCNTVRTIGSLFIAVALLDLFKTEYCRKGDCPRLPYRAALFSVPAFLSKANFRCGIELKIAGNNLVNWLCLFVKFY